MPSLNDVLKHEPVRQFLEKSSLATALNECDPFQDAAPCWQFTTVLEDGRVFPTLDGPALSWDIGSCFTLADEQNGYVKTLRLIRAFRELRPEQLERERRELVKASFNRMFGHNAKKLLALVEGED